MLTEQEIEKLCTEPETAVLDFKKQFYDFRNDTDGRAAATLVPVLP